MVMESIQNCVQNKGVIIVSFIFVKIVFFCEKIEFGEIVILNNGNFDDILNSCYKERNGVISDSIKNGFLMGVLEKFIKNGVMGCELRIGKENGLCKDEKRCNKNIVEEESLQVKKFLCIQFLKKEFYRINKGVSQLFFIIYIIGVSSLFFIIQYINGVRILDIMVIL